MEIMQGDCIERLSALGDNSVDAIVTDPPYSLGFMGKAWDKTGIAFSVGLWRAALRVLKPGGHLLSFGGTRTYHRLTCAIEDAGFEIRDSLLWLYGTGFPKSLNIGDGIGTALKPAYEPIVLARKPLDGTVAANVLKWGTGGLNIDGGRIDGTPRTTHADGNHKGQGTAIGAVALEPGHISAGAQGRWPANVMLDEEAAAQLDEQSGERKVSGAARNGKPATAARTGGVTDYAMRVGNGALHADSGGASRFFYVAKASRKEREAGCEALPLKSAGETTDREDGSAGLNSPRAGAGRTSGARNHHPTVKPVQLMRYLVKLVTPPNGLVLDPFAGSGSTGIACVKEGKRFIGIELEPDYIDIAQARIAHAIGGRL